MYYAILEYADESFQMWVDISPDLLPMYVSKAGNPLVRLRVDDPIPSYNSITQQVVEDTPIVEPTQVRRTWKVVPLPIPEAVSQRQLRLWLLSVGVTDDMIKAQINSNPDSNARAAALIEYEYASEYRRDHPLIAQLGAAMGFTSSQIDIGFQTAATL